MAEKETRMSMHIHLKQDFNFKAIAEEYQAVRPVLPVAREVFEDITAPVKNFLKDDPVYAEYETGVAFQLESVMQLLQDAWVKEVNCDKSEMREGLRGALQGIMETLSNEQKFVVDIDFEDLLNIVKYREAANDGADIHERFMGNETQAAVLREFSNGILEAQNRKWMPAFDATQPSNDEAFYQPKTA